MSDLVFKLKEVKEINKYLKLSFAIFDDIRKFIHFAINKIPKDFAKKDMINSLAEDFKRIENSIRDINQLIEQGISFLTSYDSETNKLFDSLNNDTKKLSSPEIRYKEYIIQPGDTLWSIAEKHLGDGNRYQEIAKHNKIKNPNLIYAGYSLEIPEKEYQEIKEKKVFADKLMRDLDARVGFSKIENEYQKTKEREAFEAKLKKDFDARVAFSKIEKEYQEMKEKEAKEKEAIAIKLMKDLDARVAFSKIENEYQKMKERKLFNPEIDSLEGNIQDYGQSGLASRGQELGANLNVDINNLQLTEMPVLSSPQNGTFKSYMHWKRINSKTSPQYKFIFNEKNVEPDDRGLLRDKDGFIGVALGSYFDEQNIGSRYIFKLEDKEGKTKILPVVKVEQKNNQHTDENGFYAKGDGSVIEFVIDDNKQAEEAFGRSEGLISGGNFNDIFEFKGKIINIWKVEEKF